MPGSYKGLMFPEFWPWNLLPLLYHPDAVEILGKSVFGIRNEKKKKKLQQQLFSLPESLAKWPPESRISMLPLQDIFFFFWIFGTGS